MSDLIKSSAFMALGTLLSRITGLIRGLLTVALLGTALLGDTYNVGNTAPNIIYNLLIGGALTAVFVPQIVRSFRDEDGGSGFVSRLITLIGTLILSVTILAMLFAPALVSLYAPTFDGRAREITIAFTLFCLPQILFYGLFGVLGQVTNAKEKFGPMMWSPIANNLVVIALFGYFLSVTDDLSVGNISDQQVLILGVGTTLGIAIQALILIPYIKRSGLKLTARFDWRNSGLGKSLRLGSWTLFSVLISQIGFLITVNLATRSGLSAINSGIEYGVGYTPYANAYLILMLPHSIATISIITAILPKLSKLVIDNKKDELRSEIRHALRLVAIIAVPATFVFFTFGTLIGKSLFFGIDEKSAEYLGRVLAAFALGAIPLSMNLVGIRVLNAFENTRYQFISTLITNLFAIIASLIFFIFWKPEQVVIGLAFAFAISYWVGLFVTDTLLAKFTGGLLLSTELGFYLKVSLAAGSAVALVAIASRVIGHTGNFIELILVLISTTILYLLFAKVWRIREVSETLRVLLRRGK
ncbi:MAG: murein biosynthesis integral membrane protein MurJ [Actinomycetales bacterium]|nr:murein biosynthesis integral membrane protein MurJ [Actinomycetales bacterium]